jgi:hypothetical protein
MRPNHLKGKLKAGQPALGCSVMFPSPQIVEMLGHAGFAPSDCSVPILPFRPLMRPRNRG